MKPHLPLTLRKALCAALTLTGAGAFAYSTTTPVAYLPASIENIVAVASDPFGTAEPEPSTSAASIALPGRTSQSYTLSAPSRSASGHATPTAAPLSSAATEAPPAAATVVEAAVASPADPAPLVANPPASGSYSAPLLQASSTYPNGNYSYSGHSSPIQLTANRTWQGYETIRFANNTGGAIDNFYSNYTTTFSNCGTVTFSGNSAGSGGAIDGTTTISGCGDITFSDNSASSGGAIDGTTTISGCGDITFSGNSATNGHGGAIDGTTTISDCGTVTFSANTAFSSTSFSFGGAIYGTTTISDCDDITFSGNSASYYGGAIDGTTTISGCGDITFSGNSATNGHGGAIDGTTTISDCGTVTFSANSSNGSGGAICNVGTTTISGCGDVSFNGNSATSGGGAIAGTTTISDCGTVSFSGNSTTDRGGAIDGTTTISDCGTVTFSGNSVTSGGGALSNSGGGAISNTGSTTISGCGDVSFNGNTVSLSSSYAANGGAIRSNAHTFSGNRSVSFCGNSVSNSETNAYGGAVTAYNALSFSGNDAVSFSGNSVSGVSHAYGGAVDLHSSSMSGFRDNGDICFSENTSTAVYNARGGALYIWKDSVLDFTDNANLCFRANRCTSSIDVKGGAIYAEDDSMLIIRGAAGFEKNVEVSAGTYRLRSIYQYGGSLVLSAATDKSIDFRDSIYSGAGTVIFNRDYAKSDGSTQTANGTIRFSGKDTAADLAEMKGSAATAAEIAASRTSDIRGEVQLHGGTLSIEDGAVLKTSGLVAYAGATVSLSSARLNTGSFFLDEGAQLCTQGTSSLSFDTLTLSQAIANSGSLTLTGIIDAGALDMQAELHTYIDAEGRVAESGFAKTAYNAVVVVEGGLCSGGTVTHAGQTLVLAADGIAATRCVVDYSTYHQNSGSVSMSSIRAAAGEAGVTVKLSGGTLVLDGGALSSDVALSRDTILAFGEGEGEFKGTLRVTSETGTTVNAGAAIYDSATGTATLAGTAAQALRLDGVQVNMAAGTTLRLQNVVLAAGATLTDDSATLLAEGLTVEVRAANAELADAQLMTAASMTLSGHGVEVGSELQPAAGSTLRIITLHNISDFDITGSALCLDLSAYEQLADATDSDYLAILFASATMDLSTLTVTANINGQTLTAYYDSTQPQGAAYFDLHAVAAPEPSSSALALLALAALAARRRRR